MQKGDRSLSGQLWREHPWELVKDGRSPTFLGQGWQDLALTLRPPFPPAPPAGFAGARPRRELCDLPHYWKQGVVNANILGRLQCLPSAPHPGHGYPQFPPSKNPRQSPR